MLWIKGVRLKQTKFVFLSGVDCCFLLHAFVPLSGVSAVFHFSAPVDVFAASASARGRIALPSVGGPVTGA